MTWRNNPTLRTVGRVVVAVAVVAYLVFSIWVVWVACFQ